MAPTSNPFNVFIVYLTFFCSFQSLVLSFSIDLIHRYSPQSPFYNSSATRFEDLNIAFQSSLSRASYFNKKTTESVNEIESQITSMDGAYLMKLSIGTPAVPMLAIADTGSDLTWTQCEPCDHCYHQSSPLFNPENSSTFRKLSCNTKSCSDVGTSTCSDDIDNTCQYRMSYGDRSYSIGDLASDTFTFGSTSGKAISIGKMLFGCGHSNKGTFRPSEDGVIGLGGGALSIINQLSGSIYGRFSYCLVPIGTSANVTSKISFGHNANVSGPNVVSTPLIKKSINTFYYVTLESISVGNKSLAYQKYPSKISSSDGSEGNIIIDSGTTLTLLPSEFYEELESELKQAINAEPVSDPQGAFRLCYRFHEKIDVPTLTVEFTGAKLELLGNSTFVQVSDELICLAMIPSEEFAIFGNLSQMNYLIGYDLEKNEISFKPTDCTKN